MQKINPLTKSKLRPKQAKFVQEYIRNGGNGTQAALLSYDTTDENTAHVIASENLQKPTIAEEIAQACRNISLTPERVLSRLNRVLDQDQRTVAAAQVINDMTGWRAPLKVDNTHRLGASEDVLLESFE